MGMLSDHQNPRGKDYLGDVLCGVKPALLGKLEFLGNERLQFQAQVVEFLYQRYMTSLLTL